MASRYKFSVEEIEQIVRTGKANKDKRAETRLKALELRARGLQCHHIREYRYAYGAVEPITGDSCFLVMPYCNTVCMNVFLRELSVQFSDDVIMLCCDGAAWHKSRTLEIPDNIVLFYIPPYTPEMNPIEQIWKELRKIGFHNEVFATLERVVDRLCETICSLSPECITSITCRSWIIEAFN